MWVNIFMINYIILFIDVENFAGRRILFLVGVGRGIGRESSGWLAVCLRF